MSAEFLCDTESIYNALDQCAFVTKYCTDPDISSRYLYSFYFCFLNGINFFFFILTVIFLGTAFYILASTADMHLSPSVSKIYKKLNISETLAGVTFLAFANGAPDVISSFSAAENKEGIPLVIGAIFGGGLFITMIVLATVILAAKSIIADRMALLRDVGFYLIGTVYIILLGVIKSVNIASAVGFLLIYPCYVFAIYRLEKIKAASKLNSPFLANADTMAAYASMANSPTKLPSSQQSIELGSTYKNELETRVENMSSAVASKPKLDPIETTESIEKGNKNVENFTSPTNQNAVNKQELLHNATKERNGRCWGCLNTMEKMFRIYQIPFKFLRGLTIPAVEDEQWNKIFAMVQPFTCVWFILLATGYFFQYFSGVWIGLYLLPIQAAASGAIWKYTSMMTPPRLGTPIALCGLILSVLWIYQIAVIVVEYLEFIGFLTQLHPTFLGLSLLAWGNSMGDLFGNRSLARMGYGIMALTGCFAGPLFNLLIGFGISMFRQVLNSPNHSIDFSLFSFDEQSVAQGGPLAIGVMFFTILNLIMTLIYAKLRDCNFTRKYSIILFVGYTIGTTAAIVYSFHLKISYAQN